MRKGLRVLLIPAAFAMVAGAGIATTATPAKAQVFFGVDVGAPYYYYRPYRYYYTAPSYYYFRPVCHWDAFYGRVCY